jgi:hypothetical protein
MSDEVAANQDVLNIGQMHGQLAGLYLDGLPMSVGKPDFSFAFRRGFQVEGNAS